MRRSEHNLPTEEDGLSHSGCNATEVPCDMNGAGSEGPRVSPHATGGTWIPGTARTDPVISLGTLGPH
jgi:hypothetical protein